MGRGVRGDDRTDIGPAYPRSELVRGVWVEILGVNLRTYLGAQFRQSTGLLGSQAGQIMDRDFTKVFYVNVAQFFLGQSGMFRAIASTFAPICFLSVPEMCAPGRSRGSSITSISMTAVSC